MGTTTEELLLEAADAAEAIECTRSDGYHCRVLYDTDLCPICTVSLLIARAHRSLTGTWGA